MTQGMQHCLSIEDLSTDAILTILKQASTFIEPQSRQIKPKPCLTGKVICLAFFEPSTRTRMTFELAAKHLNAHTIQFDSDTSALKKGETMIDTVDTLLAMGIDGLVIRHQQEGIPGEVAQFVSNRAHVINAGDGCHEHPTQALLDLFTIQQHKGALENVSVAICGDISHSRVARSQMLALQKCGVKDIRLVGPDAFLPQGDIWAAAQRVTNLEQGIQGADVVIALRIQKERMQEVDYPDSDSFYQDYGLTQARLLSAKPDAIVMHPGPMNRGIEIASDVADGPQSVILQQVRNGIAVRMAVFNTLLG